MGKGERIRRKLDTWLGRDFKAYRLKALFSLAVSRLAVLRNQRRARCDHARSDVAELLRQGHQERALLRAEYVIKEQNMLDAFAMVESYCHIVTERTVLLENQKGCPDELREAIAGLLFAESRCGDLPELHEVRAIFISRLGKEFVAAAVELRNNCGVNTRIIQKLSTKPASLESRVKVTKEIAEEIGIVLHIEELSSDQLSTAPATPKHPAAGGEDISALAEDKYLSESMNMRQKYKDAASAAQAAFESAAYAAAAARAAVELSRTESQDKGGLGDGDNSHPVQIPRSETENKQGQKQGNKPMQHPEAKTFARALPKGDDLHHLGKQRVAYSTSEEEDESEEEGAGGGGEFVGNPTGLVHDPHGLQGRGQFDESSDEGTSDEEGEEIEPQTANLHQQRSPESRQGSWERSQPRPPSKSEYRYRKEEEEVDEETPAILLGGKSRFGEWNAGDPVAVHKLGIGKVPVSMRTRRSGF